MFKDVPLTAITIGPRFRKDLGDIAALAESIEQIGLLHPIIVTTNHTLVVGRRRLAAHVHLGRLTIRALVLDFDTLLNAEFDENERRKALNPSERVAIIEALHEHLEGKAKARQREHGNTAPGRKKNTSVNFTEVSETPPQVRDEAAKAVGWSGPTYAKARAIVEAAREDPDFQPLVDRMDRTGKVDRVYKDLPAYVREPEADIEAPPRPPRPLKYDVILKRVDAVLQNSMVPHLRALSDEERDNLRTLIRFYLTMIDKEEEAAHGHSRC